MVDIKKGKPAQESRKCEREYRQSVFSFGNENKKKGRPSLLLHSCCGPCSTSVIERLISIYDVTVFFYNPNITDGEEYQKRKRSQLKFIDRYNSEHVGRGLVNFREGIYEPEIFRRLARGFEDEPEGGKRCIICFEMRMEKTAQTAKLLGQDCFATTLTVSPHKDYSIISKIGTRLGIKYGIEFLDIDFKKKDGFKRSVELSKQYGLYRQNYCGCEYIKR